MGKNRPHTNRDTNNDKVPIISDTKKLTGMAEGTEKIQNFTKKDQKIITRLFNKSSTRNHREFAKFYLSKQR